MANHLTERDRELALAFLLDRVDFERAVAVSYGKRTYKLERMRRLLSLLGDPQNRMPIVHVAGSKGKGSTAAMIAAVLSAAGYTTGLYSSPHLDRLEERMTVDAQQCTVAELVDLVATLRAAVERMRGNGSRQAEPTYFELTTAMALLHFSRRGVDAAVLEVGMGGRLDSTNVCSPVVSVITSISFDHVKQLGDTLAAIAGEKAGIVKPGVPVVSGVTDDEPKDVIARICNERGSRLIQAGVDFDFVYHPPRKQTSAADADSAAPPRRLFDVRTRSANPPLGRLVGLKLGLIGRHQAANAAVAVAVVGELVRQGWRIEEPTVRAGLAKVKWPVRVELVSRRPLVIVDSAHNVASLAATIETLDESFVAERRLLIFATTQEKDVRGMLQLALPRFDRVILTRYTNNPRGVPVAQLESIAAELGATHCTNRPDPHSAWRAAGQWARESDLICASGSFFLAAEIRAQIGSAPPAGTPAVGAGNI